MSYGRTDIRPSKCPTCRALHRANRVRTRSGIGFLRSVDVRSWCRGCGKPAMLKVLLDYQTARRKFMALDRQKMEQGDHFEDGGWGVLWRLDEVLAALFPHEYADDPTHPLWPVPPWSPAEKVDYPIDIIRSGQAFYMPMERRERHREEVERQINEHPKTRAELETQVGKAWDWDEVNREFDLLGDIGPYALVVRRSDGAEGSLIFQRTPRLYWSFEDRPV